MPNTVIDQNKTFEAIEERIAKTTNPRHLAMLKLVLTHAKGEAGPDLDMVMDTLGKHPAYHSWTARPEMSPVGREAVRDFYLREVVQAGRHFFQFVIDRMVVDDETVITEGYMTMLYTGGDAIATGLPVDDPEAFYAVKTRMMIVWPFDEDGMLAGEDSYSAPAREGFITKLAPDEVPAKFRAFVASRDAKAA
jgi:hypothetical protein